jgi:putative 4-mercaptohistidine N1-methyltranferase
MPPATSPLDSPQNSSTQDSNPYETDSSLREYLLFHYATATEVLPHAGGPHDALEFAVRCVRDTVDASRMSTGARALDLGCAVGRSSYELARHCSEVVGIDYSARFIAAAETIRREGALPYDSLEEGSRFARRIAVRPSDVDFQRIRFQTGDAMRLPRELGVFDVVLMANLIDRLSDPAAALRAMRQFVVPGGQLVVTSPYTWMEQYTPRNRWLCSVSDDAEHSSLAGLRKVLGSAFELRRTLDLPLLIREHARKYQWSVAQASCWVRSDQ